MDTGPALAKIGFDLPSEGSDFGTEWLWAKPVGDDVYEIDNVPWQVFGVSAGDVVLAQHRDGALRFVRVVRRSGHSTYRVKLPEGRDHDYFLSHWGAFADLGCSFEGSGGSRRLYAIDVPDPRQVPAVYIKLQTLEEIGVWEFEEGHYAGSDHA